MLSWGVLLGRGYILDEAASIPNLPRTLRLSRLPDEVLRAIGPAQPLIEIAAPGGPVPG